MSLIRVATYPWQEIALHFAASDQGLVRVAFDLFQSREEFQRSLTPLGTVLEAESAFQELFLQLERYFSGQPVSFEVALDLRSGTAFQKAVWQRVRQIPYGRWVTYGQIAGELGRPGAARAVGLANGANPIPIIIPCHRVVQSDGKLGGYSAGLRIKDALLRLERSIL